MAKRKARNVDVSSDDDEEEAEEVDEEEEEEKEETSDEEVKSDSDEDDDDESVKREALKKLLEPFGKEQIIDILKESAAKDPSIFARIIQKAESDPTHRKIFIYGLGWDATEEQLLEVFKPFGEIEEHKLITEKGTGRAKGYAFVLFKSLSSAQEALKVPKKKIGSRITSCQLASLGPSPAGNNAIAAGGAADVDAAQRKLFVKNVGPTVNVDRLRAFFGSFGEIENGPAGLDPATNKPRGYAIFTYKSVDGLKKALQEPVKFFEGIQLNCRKFMEGHQNANLNKNPGANTGNVNYGQGLNVPETFDSNMTAGAMVMQQNPGIGLVANPLWAASTLNQAGLGVAMPGIGTGYALANYGAPAALQGFGASIGQSSVGGAAGGTGSLAWNQPAVGPSGMNFPSYYSS